MLMSWGFWGAMVKPSPADAHDAGGLGVWCEGLRYLQTSSPMSKNLTFTIWSQSGDLQLNGPKTADPAIFRISRTRQQSVLCAIRFSLGLHECNSPALLPARGNRVLQQLAITLKDPEHSAPL